MNFMIRSLMFQLLALSIASCGSHNSTLYLLVLAPFPSQYHPLPTFSRGESLIPAVDLAIEHINNSSHILPNHTLETIVGDSACNISTETILPFVKHVVTETKPVLGIVGPACTEASLALAEITQRNRYDIIQAMMATSDVLEDHERYINTFGMVSSFNILVDTLLNIAKAQSWFYMGILFDSSREFFLRTFNSFTDRAANFNVSSNSWPVLTPDYLEKPLNELRSNRSTRVIFAILSANTARHVACLAGIKGLTYPQYQFVYADRSLSNFLTGESFTFTDVNTFRCNDSIIMKGLNGSIFLRYGLDSIPSGKFLNETAKLTVGEVKDQYKQKLVEHGNQKGENLTVSTYAYPYYDATWAMALSIHQAIEELGLENFLFNTTQQARVIHQKFADLNFQGSSVQVKFDSKTGHVSNKVDIFQVNGTSEITESITYIRDHVDNEYIRLHPVLVVAGIVLTVVALVVITALHLINIHFRDYPTIKASSPRLNHFIFIGCYLILLSVLFETIQYGFLMPEDSKTAREVLCNLSVFLHPVSLALIISTVCVKLWRLYSIFNRAFKKQYMLHDKFLALIILVLVTLTVLFSIPWLAADRFVIKDRVYTEEEGVLTIEGVCSPLNDSIVPILPFIIVFLQATFSFLMAYLNRKIRLNEYRSKETIIFTYLFCLNLGITGLCVALLYLLKLRIDAIYSLNVFGYLCAVFLCNIVLFVPPFYPILKGKLTDSQQTLDSKVGKVGKTLSNMSIL